MLNSDKNKTVSINDHISVNNNGVKTRDRAQAPFPPPLLNTRFHRFTNHDCWMSHDHSKCNERPHLLVLYCQLTEKQLLSHWGFKPYTSIPCCSPILDVISHKKQCFSFCISYRISPLMFGIELMTIYHFKASIIFIIQSYKEMTW